jgi:hypothetical protein
MRTARIDRSYAVWLSDCIVVEVPDEVEDVEAWAVENYGDLLVAAVDGEPGHDLRWLNEWEQDVVGLDPEITVGVSG